jgi:putative ABC transport system ATP-binding protein
VGFVFQFYNLIPSLTARENVELACDAAERPIAAAMSRAWIWIGDGPTPTPRRWRNARAACRRPAIRPRW